MMAYCLAINAADADGSAEEEENIDGKSHVVDEAMCCSNTPVACNEMDSAFLVSPVDWATYWDVTGEINVVGFKAAVPGS